MNFLGCHQFYYPTIITNKYPKEIMYQIIPLEYFPASYYPSAQIRSQPVHLPIHFPEEIHIILRSDRLNYGNLYLSNIEAA